MIEVSPEEAEGLASGDGGAFLLDVREDAEVTAGRAPGSVQVPLGSLPDHVDDLPADRRIVCICRSGNRSARAAQYLSQRGLDAVNMSGGMKAWVAAGLEVETPAGGPGRVV
ncbi:MAG: rhodanese-like domain-containing protein [Acidimicrobiia bacterium]